MLGDVTCLGHDGCIDSSLGSSVRGHTGFMAMVRTTEPVAHKPLGAGRSVLFYVSYINQQGGVRSKALYKHGTNIRHHFLSIRAALISSVLNRRADMLSRKWKLHLELVQVIWTRYGTAEVDLFTTSENALVVLLLLNTDISVQPLTMLC